MKNSRTQLHKAVLALGLAASLVGIGAARAQTTGSSKAAQNAAPKPKTSIAKALPPKKTKRTFIDFSKDSGGPSVVFKSLSPGLSPSLSPIDRALVKSDIEVTEVRSRRIVAAPPGDLAEPLTAFAARPAVAPKSPTKPSPPPAPAPTPRPTVTAETSPPAPSAAPTKIDEEPPAPAAPERLVVQPTSEPAPAERPAMDSPLESPAASTLATSKISELRQDASSATTHFFRTGYLDAGYKKFDDRMSSGATSIGYAAAQDFETSFGLYEARVGFDIFHATDQSVSLANVRMLALRVDATHWFTSTRVKPGLSIGSGLTETSIRSYRSTAGSSSQGVSVRTHAEGLSVAVIPAAVLRVELSGDFKVDIQAEYLGLFGSAASDAARGTAVTISFGWRP